MCIKRSLVLVFVLICLTERVRCQVVVDVNVKNLLKMQHGLGWPHSLRVAEGNEALLRLDTDLVERQTCEVTTPSGQTFNVQSPPSNRPYEGGLGPSSTDFFGKKIGVVAHAGYPLLYNEIVNRYTSWSDGCGVRVRNVVEADEGRWRLTAVRANVTVTGWTELYVEVSRTSYTAPPISLQDGQTETKVELTTLDNSYCLVSKPFSESSLVPGHCSVTLDRTTRAVQGNWNVLLGIPGQVAELNLERHVTVESERLDVGYVHDRSANKLNLYCNIVHTAKNITFCRFQKTTESHGYNVVDGLSDGRHSYYGEGFSQRQCGMTIESPTNEDYGTWRCSVGLQMWVGTHIVPQTPMQALISVAYNTRDSRVVRDIPSPEDEIRTVFVQSDMAFTLTCNAEASLAYCWFQHPNGTQYTPGQLVDEEQPFWYTGESLQVGDCGITFSHATADDAGEWICHMGPRDQLGVEITDKALLRVTGPLAAVQKEVSADVGGTATLNCHTANGNRPLDYCRFLSPTRLGVRVDESVTVDNAILDRYFFTPGRSLDHGECSLTISPVLEEDIGDWTCAALINRETLEARDHITIYVDVAETQQFRAGIIGMSIGVVALVVVFAGVLVYKRFRPSLIPWGRARNTPSENNFSMSTRISDAGSLDSQ